MVRFCTVVVLVTVLRLSWLAGAVMPVYAAPSMFMAFMPAPSSPGRGRGDGNFRLLRTLRAIPSVALRAAHAEQLTRPVGQQIEQPALDTGKKIAKGGLQVAHMAQHLVQGAITPSPSSVNSALNRSTTAPHVALACANAARTASICPSESPIQAQQLLKRGVAAVDKHGQIVDNQTQRGHNGDQRQKRRYGRQPRRRHAVQRGEHDAG